jgi:sec-independent protein translocase protein TatC
MPRGTDNDLFQSSTMTFGEHLEELRGCLLRAAGGLLVAVLVGLAVARPVVHLIEQPLKRALGEYYTTQALATFDAWQPRVAGGAMLPYSRAEVVDAVERHGLSFELRELHVDRLAPQPAGGGTLPAGGDTLPAGGGVSSGTAAFDPGSLAPVLLWQPLARDSRVTITTLSAQEAFGIYVKAALLVGIVLSSPWIFYQLWTFVAAGLYPHEKKWVWTFLPVSIGLFLAGVFLAFFFVFDFVLDYLLQFNAWLGLDPDPRISEWLSFVLILPLGFGIGFQLPLVMLFLERIGIFDAESYASQWRIAVLVIVIASALLTPADPYSMLFLAAPLCLLYFGGLMLCRWFGSEREAAFQATAGQLATNQLETTQLETKASQ